jgi:uncharacterized protein with beta-barrel porin domain
MKHLDRKHRLTVAAGALALFLSSEAVAQDFTVNSGEVAGQQVMSNPADVGIVRTGGRIFTTNDLENAVEMLNIDQSLANEAGGTIETLGNDAFGVFSNGARAQISNDGTIVTLGDSSDGVSSYGVDASILNSGLIETSGSQVVGIFAGASGANIRNIGTIASTGLQEAYGIASIGNGSIIRNVGSIQVGDVLLGGLAPIGVLSSGIGSEIRNSGSVRATGTAAFGILSDGGQAEIRNDGSIAADGLASVALLSAGDGSIISNTGRIGSSGVASVGILSTGADTTLTNSGKITSDLTEFAIIMAGDGAILDLRAGTAIQGNISFAGANGTLTIGNGLNTALTFFTTPAFLDTNGAPFAISGNTLAVVDTTGFTSQDEVVADFTGAIADALDDRFAAARSRARGGYPAVNGMLISPVADVSPDSGVEAWGAALGGYRSQDRTNSGSDFDNVFGGFVFGVDGMAGSSTRLGLLAGTTMGKMQTSSDSQAIGNENYFAGAYASFAAEGHFLHLSAAAGLSQFESERRVANNLVLGGIEHARADYDGIFVSPAATIGTEIAMGSGLVTPSIRARYAGLFLDDYEEHGSAANMDVDGRRVDVFELRGELAYSMAPIDTESGVFDTSIRAGVDGTFGDGGTVDAILLGQPLAISAGNEDTVIRGFAGLRTLFTASNGIQVSVASELGLDTGSAFTASGRIELLMPF